MKTKIILVVACLLSLVSTAFAAPVMLKQFGMPKPPVYVKRPPLFVPPLSKPIALPVPATQLDASAKLTLARALVGEASWSMPDHFAIPWVFAKRYQDIERRWPGKYSFESVIKAYSAPMKIDTARALWVQNLPWGPMNNPKYADYERGWARVREVVNAWTAGLIPDPCPNAAHFGGPMDAAPAKWAPVNCGKTENIFYGTPEHERRTKQKLVAWQHAREPG